MTRKFPVDFEEKVKLPAQVGNAGYPYRISAGDLMDNFRHVDILVDETEVSGLYITETIDPFGRTIKLAGAATTGTPTEVVVVDNGVLKRGMFLIEGYLEDI